MPARQGQLGNLLRHHRIVARLGVGQAVVARHPVHRRQHPLHGADVGRAFRHGVQPRGIGEGVEIDRPVIAAGLHGGQQLQRGLGVHGADHQPVVALGIAVVQVQAQQARPAHHQRRRKGGLFVGVKRVRKVDGDAQVRSPRFVNRQKGGRGIGQDGIAARFVGLVFQADQTLRVMRGDLGDGRDLVLPQPGIVALEGIVPAVLAQPQRHHRGAHGAGGVDAAFGQVDRLAPDGPVGVGEGAALEGGVGVIAHRQPADLQPAIAHHGGGFGRGADVVGEVQVQFRQAGHGGGAFDHLAQGGLGRLAGPIVLCGGGERVDPGGEALAEHVIPLQVAQGVHGPARAAKRFALASCRAAEFLKIPRRSLQRLRSDFFQEIGAAPGVSAAPSLQARTSCSPG